MTKRIRAKGVEEELEAPEQWDWTAAERREPSQNRRIIVSVAFDREGFHAVAACARNHQLPVSRFIRQAALEKAEREARFVTFTWSSGNRASTLMQGVPMVYTETQARPQLPAPVSTN